MLTLCSLAIPVFAESLTEQIIPAQQRVHDFGTVARAAKTEHRFEIKNPFPQRMHLQSISASCGCTTPIIESEWIEPGQTGTVMARFNTGTFSGDRKASLNLFIDQPQAMQLQLNVKGYIRSDIVINPGELNFGTVAEGASKQIEATIEYAGKSDWQISSISSNADFIQAEVAETSRSPGRVTYKVSATILPGATAGTQATQLTLHTNDQRLKAVPLSCFAQVQPPLSVHPPQIALGEMKPGQQIQQRLLVKGTEPFHITEILVPNMQVKFDPPAEAKAVQFVNVTLIPETDGSTSEVSATMIIKTDLEGDRQIALDVSYKLAQAKQPPIETQPVRTRFSDDETDAFD